MAKRKRAAAKPAALPVDDAAINQLVLLLVTVDDADAIRAAATEKLQIPAAAIDAAIDEARRRLTLAADFHRVEELGRAVRRLHNCYARSIKIQDVKTALATQKELNKLLDLYRQRLADDDAGESEAEQELAAVRAYLEPLDLAGPDASTAELARLAVAAITAREE